MPTSYNISSLKRYTYVHSIHIITIFAWSNKKLEMSYKSVKFVIDLLKKNGYVLKSQKGSHM